MSILLSIIIPVYNTSPFLEKCVESILKQNIAQMEIILVDDGSTDTSPDLCDRFSLFDERIITIHQANAGISAARNRGLEICRGKYITFADSDDILLENTYASNIEILERDETITAVQFPYIYPYNQPSSRSGANTKMSWKEEKEILKGYMSPLINHAVWNKIFRRSIFSSLRFPEGHLFEDSYIVPDLAKNIYCLYSSGLGGYGYNLQPQSIMSSEMTPEKMQDRFLAYEHILHAASSHPDIQKSPLFIKYYHVCAILCIGIQKQINKHGVNLSPDYMDSLKRFQATSYRISTLFKKKTLSSREKIRLLLIKITGLPFYLSRLA